VNAGRPEFRFLMDPGGSLEELVLDRATVLTTAGRLALEEAATRDDSRIVELRDGARMTREAIGTWRPADALVRPCLSLPPHVR
jgi:hypothetical protein